MYITNLNFGYMRSTWFKKKGSIFHKPVEFVGYTQTPILVDISEHPTEVESSYLIWIYPFHFLSSHFLTFLYMQHAL